LISLALLRRQLQHHKLPVERSPFTRDRERFRQKDRQSMPGRSAGARLRALLTAQPIVVAPGVWDGLSARLVAEAGFAAAYCTGGGIARGRGFPDLGLVTLSELAATVSNIAEVCDLPLIVDLDSGFGNVLNIRRGVGLIEHAGAAALHIQDVEVPRRAATADIIPVPAMIGRLRAAADARRDENFLIIARTDVGPLLGLDAAIERANQYVEAGVDMVYVEGMVSRADVELVARQVGGTKLVSLNKGETVLTHPADAQLTAIAAMRRLLQHLKREGTTAEFEPMASFPEREAIVGLADAQGTAARFLDPAAVTPPSRRGTGTEQSRQEAE
jgi:2-methylisocitrate lyase-like PEP mutase family enzyme